MYGMLDYDGKPAKAICIFNFFLLIFFKETYFSQPNKKLPPKGKIWDRYQGRKRYMRKVMNISFKGKTKNDTTIDGLDETLDKTNWSEMEALCAQMKTITNEKELLAKWMESFTYRRYQLQSEFFSNWKLYFDEYPFVKQQNYAQYVSFIKDCFK